MSFSRVIGHDFQKEALSAAARGGRASHAYIFSGPEGVGKKLVALAFAKALNCKGGGCAEEGEQCGSCSKIERGIHPDVFVVEYKGLKDIKVEQIREEVAERVQRSPFEGLTKVAVVDEAHRMNRGAQNAFLKTLEEPPRDTVIILLTSQLNRLLPTIRSRCQVIEFAPLRDEEIIGALTERGDVSDADARVTASLTGGSLGKALRFDQKLQSFRRDVLGAICELDPDSAGDVLGFVEGLPKTSSKEDTEKLGFLFDFVSLLIQDVMRIKLGFGEEELANTDMVSYAKTIAARMDMDAVLEKRAAVESARRAVLYTNANKQIALENFVIKMAG
ncbi:MAG: DNA polymerase III subunit delta' [Candidatus Dadabacteria bacterium]|nr:DNA polymerase III subunit delta' [Candidatus Dadabacteria bacterium]